MQSTIVVPEGGLLGQLPVTSSLIVAQCALCGEERPAHEQVDGFCLDCRVGKALAPLHARLIELMRKQNRYARRGHSSLGSPDQIGRQLRRMWDVIRTMVADKAKQGEFMSRAIQDAQERAA